jgi:NADH dehydrogenase
VEKKNIAILGAGFGGLRAAKQLAKQLPKNSGYEVILIDRNDHHTYTPLLYEIATTSKETADNTKLHELAAYSIKELINGLPIQFIQDEVKDIEPSVGKIFFASGKILKTEYLVAALGSETNFFGIPGLEEYSLPLKTFWDAIKIRETVLTHLKEKDKLKILVGGGGSTGVEIAGEIKKWINELKEDFPKCAFEVGIIEGNQTILPGFDRRVVRAAHKRLAKLGVRLFEGERVKELTVSKAMLASGREMDCDIFIWTGGVKASGIMSKLPVEKDEHGRAEVKSGMECVMETGLKFGMKFYALGDAVCFLDPQTKKPIPGVAEAAISEADVAAHNILEDIRAEQNPNHKPRHKTYKPVNYPYIIPIGGKYAISKVGPLIISGILAWIIKGLVEIGYLLSIMPPGRAFSVWIQGLWTFIQNDRLG